MVSDYCNRHQIEHFLRNASAEELLEQRSRIQHLQQHEPMPVNQAERLVARIAYELRFRVAQPV